MVGFFTECLTVHIFYTLFQVLKQEVADQKPSVDRLNKTGAALLKLIGDEESAHLQDQLEDDNNRFDQIKNGLRERSNTLDEAFQETSEVSIETSIYWVHINNKCLLMFAVILNFDDKVQSESFKILTVMYSQNLPWIDFHCYIT